MPLCLFILYVLTFHTQNNSFNPQHLASNTPIAECHRSKCLLKTRQNNILLQYKAFN